MEKKIFITSGKLAADDDMLKAKREALRNKLMNGGKVVLKKDGNVMDGKGEDSSIAIPKGKLASSDDMYLSKREELKNKLMNGERIWITTHGRVMTEKGENTFIMIPVAKFAADDDMLKAKREALRNKLMNGGKVVLKKDGNVMDGKGENASISVPPGKLAAYYWYDRDPELLDMEKAAMHKCFPDFKLDRMDDGRLYWIGTLTPGIYETKYGIKKDYTVMAVYNDNHPHQDMGSSVRVYPLFPDVKELIRGCGFRPHHLLTDSCGENYLCTNEADDVKVGSTVTTAASVLGWAVKWLSCYELVLTGDLSKEEFDYGGV